jgi:1-acyl-sn-glycerol-3-phosphate acyltransferase
MLADRLRGTLRRPLQQLARGAIRGIFGALFTLSLEGTPPATGPYVLAANHQGWADAFVLMALFPADPPLVFLGDEQAVTHVWWKRAVMWVFGGVIRIDRTRGADPSAIEASLAVLRRGGVLVVFPEGRVSRREDEPIPFHRGVAYLALKAGVPIVPVRLSGTAELYLGRRLAVSVGAPRATASCAATKAATEALAREVHDDVARLMPAWREEQVARKRLRWLTDLL